MSEYISRPRAVIDCNVYVQAIGSERGPAAECLRLLYTNRIEVFVSRDILKEIRAVLRYPSVRMKLSELNDEQVELFVKNLSFRATRIKSVKHRFDYPRAHQDEPYLDLAAAAKAGFLVSRDKDLLSLMTSHAQIAKNFRQTCPGIQILKPEEFLQIIRSMEVR